MTRAKTPVSAFYITGTDALKWLAEKGKHYIPGPGSASGLYLPPGFDLVQGMQFRLWRREAGEDGLSRSVDSQVVTVYLRFALFQDECVPGELVTARLGVVIGDKTLEEIARPEEGVVYRGLAAVVAFNRFSQHPVGTGYDIYQLLQPNLP